MTTVELTRFRVDPDQEGNLLRARPAMLADFRADRAGFLDARLVQLAEGQWLDIVIWRSAADFAASRAKGANLPGISAFFAVIAELISAEQGTEHDAGEPAQPGTGSDRGGR
jgi:quinol monooxygenase YgiN